MHQSAHTSPADLHSEDALALRRRTWTLTLLTITYFFSYMDRQILAILQELIKAELRLTDTQLGLLSGFAFAIFYAGLGVPVARLADKGNRRNIIAWSLALWSATTALCGLAQNFVQLLTARILVGVGEAGSSPPSHSIIADLYPRERRAGAMGIYALGVTLGSACGSTVGGLLAYYYGWRVAIVAVGLAGVLLAVVVRLCVLEPRRGMSEGRASTNSGADVAQPSLLQGLAAMWASAPARHLVAAVTLTSLIGYAVTGWTPSYYQRSLGLSLRHISLIVAPLLALVGVISGIYGGKLADHAASTRGLHAQSWLVAILKLIALPFAVALFLFDNAYLAIGCYLMAVLLQSTYLGPTFALIQSLAPIRLRAFWAAMTLLVINLIGLGLGPTVTGMVSDALRPMLGQQSLRYALLLVVSLTPWAIYHYWRAGVHLQRQALTTA